MLCMQGGGILDEGDLIIMHVVDKTHRDLLLQASNQLSSGLALLVKCKTCLFG
jgi:hypothetical protein